MRLHQLSMNAKDQATVRSTVAFLEGRLKEKETIEWALSLGPDNILKRRAILHLLDTPEGISLREPWRSAWRLIEEFWDTPIPDFYGLGVYNVQDRLYRLSSISLRRGYQLKPTERGNSNSANFPSGQRRFTICFRLD